MLEQHLQLSLNHIFEQYFYEVNQFGRVPKNSTEYSNLVDIVDDKIAPFKKRENAPFALGSSLYEIPAYVYKLGTVMFLNPNGRTYIVDEVVHYCVANMPGGVPRTSTIALNNATLPHLVKLANNGYEKALGEDKNFLAGLNVHKGMVTYKAVADVFGHEFISPEKAITS